MDSYWLNYSFKQVSRGVADWVATARALTASRAMQVGRRVWMVEYTAVASIGMVAKAPPIPAKLPMVGAI